MGSAMVAPSTDVLRAISLVSRRRRADGDKAAVAVERAADDLGLSARKARSLLRGEPARVRPAERVSVLLRLGSWIEAERARQAVAIEALDREYQRLMQRELDL